MRKGLTAALAAGVLSAGVLGVPVAGADEHRDDSTIAAHATGGAVVLSRQTVSAGRVRISVDTTSPGGGNVLLFHPARGVSLATVFADFGEEFSQDPQTAAKGTRDLTRDARFFGGADVVPGHPAVVTENLAAATYYVIDVAAPPGPNGPALTTLTVRGGDDREEAARGGDDRESGGDDGDHSAVVRMTSDDRFDVRGRLHAHGTVLVANVSDTLHFAEFQPVKPGTTDAMVQAYFDSGAQGAPPFALNGPTTGMEVLSPGLQASLTYSLPRGTYVLLCFVSDEKTGMPHALMGMHKVVVLE